MFISHIPFKDYLGVIYQSSKLVLKIPRNKPLILVLRVLFLLIALLSLMIGIEHVFYLLIFVLSLVFVVQPTLFMTLCYYVLFGITGYTRNQVNLLSKPHEKKLAHIKEQYGAKNISQIISRGLRGIRIKDTLILVYKPSRRQLGRIRKYNPKIRIWHGKKSNNKKVRAYTMVYNYKHYLVFLRGLPFTKRPYAIIDLDDEQNSVLWNRIKADDAHYKKLVTDNVRFQIND